MSRTHFEAVIVGSGFGGSVTAYRLAEAGLDVCLLERGKAYPPGSYPRSPHEMKKNFWDPSEGLYGMFDLWSFDHFEAVASSGLGGGSLIYANVLLRKDEDWFVTEDVNGEGYEHWPVTRDTLDPHYDRVEEMMNVQKYPLDEAPYSETPKTNAFREAANELGLDWKRTPLAVTFGNDGERPVPGKPIDERDANLHGRSRSTCRLCAECDIGCNYGSKNTLDFNYLSAAEREGADIRTLHEVRSFRPRAEAGYEIDYVVHDLEREGSSTNTRQLEKHTLTADRLILGAGTLGSTFLMMRSREHLPGLSDALGSRFCGNGDLLGFAIDAEEPDPVHGGTRARSLDPNRGPVITSTIRMGDALDGDGSTGRGFYLQDAGYPNFLSWVAESANVFSTTKRMLRFFQRILSARLRGDTNLSAELQSAIGGPFSKSTLPLLGMGRDIPDGEMSLDESTRLTCDWQLKRSRDYFKRLKETMEDVANAMGADFVINPTWFLKRVITVHALGGCPMGRHDDEGVVDEYGEVFHHPNLYIADGAIMPGPVGPNPSLTIAALANRISDHIIEEAGPEVSTTEDPVHRTDATDTTNDESATTENGSPSTGTMASATRRSAIREEVVPFTAEDGYECNLIHLRGEAPPTKGPVIVVHGAGVRANIFRAAVDTVIERTGADSVQAVIHCQGSTSFALSAAAGLVPRVRTIVSNAVSLHPVVPNWSVFKMNYILPVVERFTDYLNPQWNSETASIPGRLLYHLTELTHHECDNSVCRQVSFYYGSGFPALWSHENLNDETHDVWLRREFANVPLSFYLHIRDCINAGHLVNSGEVEDIPSEITGQAPQTDARFALFGGEDNLCFLPKSQIVTHNFLDEHRPGYDSLHLLSSYGHLDVFMGKNASQDIFPVMVEELDKEN